MTIGSPYWTSFATARKAGQNSSEAVNRYYLGRRCLFDSAFLRPSYASSYGVKVKFCAAPAEIFTGDGEGVWVAYTVVAVSAEP